MTVNRTSTLHPIGAVVNLVLGVLLVSDPAAISQAIPNPAWREVARIVLVAAIGLISVWKKVPQVDSVLVPTDDTVIPVAPEGSPSIDPKNAG